MSRPDRLPRWSIHVVKASRRLTLGLKMVWLEDFHLDLGPEGAFISAGNLAERLGVGKDTVEKYRRALVRLGLHENAPRPGARTMSWFATMPAECVPSREMSVTDCITLARRLDELIDEITGNLPAANVPKRNSGMAYGSMVSKNVTPDPSMAYPDTPQLSVQSETASDAAPIETEVRGKGGALARALHGQPSVSLGKSEPESSHEHSEPEHIAGPMADVMARWNKKRSR